MKKYWIYLLVFLLLILGYLYIDSNLVKEDYKIVVIKENPVLKVYDEYKVSDFVNISGGELLDDPLFDTNEVGKFKKEIFYLNEHNKKRKAYIEYEVIDDIVPLILGGSSKTVEKGYASQLEYLFFSADNYDANPKREIIGQYDINNIGEYNLTLQVTDSSNNVSAQKFLLKVVDKIVPSSSISTTTNFKQTFNTYKKENNKIGLDISKWQGYIDFNKLLTNNVEFIMLRVGYQKRVKGINEIDSYFYTNIKKINELKIPVGIYFYSYATSVDEAKEQALWVADKIKEYNISLPVVFDFENWSNFPSLNLSLHDINAITRTFLRTIKENGYEAMNYSSKYYLENIWDIEEYPVWLAHYTNQTSYTGQYSMWQLCNNGKIEGINGNVDINVLYDLGILKD